ncbi:Flp family type IVb pilin [Pararhizobium sp. LjRoot255]|uniref:Flp family type IVb pilin n=1 Tax=Pararhizobium sp. LjRoot255 TaxID=3342298 RepID=UPI003ECD0AEF
MKTFAHFLTDKSGATVVEYGLLASLISVGIIVGLGGFSDSLLGVLDKISTAINDAPK